MTDFERKKLEVEMQAFTSRNFIRPSQCKDLEQIRFYVSELCHKIEEYKQNFDYVPDSAYVLLAEYNLRQNSILSTGFLNTYCKL